MKKDQLHFRVSPEQKEEIKVIAKNLGYDNVSKFIIDSILGKVERNDLRKKGVLTHCFAILPTIDYYLDHGSEEPKLINNFYSSDKAFVPGGKGIGISSILEKFNTKNITIHYSSGFTGEYIWNELNKAGVQQRRINSNSVTPLNIKIFNNNGDIAIYNQKPEPISEYGKEQMINYVNNEISSGENFVLAGTIRKDDSKFINKLLRDVKKKKANIILNITIDNLEEVINAISPDFVVISNEYEQKSSKAKIKKILNEYIQLGCKNVALIEDINFIFFANEDKHYMIETPYDDAQSMIGISDALTASYITLRDEEYEIDEKLKWIGATVKSKSIHKNNISYEDIVEHKKDIKVS